MQDTEATGSSNSEGGEIVPLGLEFDASSGSNNKGEVCRRSLQ